MIALGLFADGTYGAGFNGITTPVTGLLYGGGFGQLAAQLIACVTVAAWAFGTFYIFFVAQKAVMGLRSSEADEINGLDATEMGVLAYPDFAGNGPLGAGSQTESPVPSAATKPVGSEA
jgi:Amt family ammonium transporter